MCLKNVFLDFYIQIYINTYIHIYILYRTIIIIRAVFIQGNLVNTMSIVINKGPV